MKTFFHIYEITFFHIRVLIFRETFGESLNWAGCTIITLLGQEHRFEALDFSAHLLRVQEIDSRQETVAGVVSFNFIQANIRRFAQYLVALCNSAAYVFNS